MYTIGIDVGGTSIKCGLVDSQKIVCKESKQTTKSGNLDELVKDIKSLIDSILKKNNIKIESISRIGIGIPGIVNKDETITCLNLGLKNSQMKLKLQQIFPTTRISIENDGTLATLGEYKYGSMIGYNLGVMITLGTGIGGSIIVNGNVIDGLYRRNSEIGHMTIESNYFDCECGNNGCFETFCSATAIIKYVQKLIDEGYDSLILDKCHNKKEDINAKIIFDAYIEKDRVAVEAINRFKEYLVKGIVNIIHFIDPEVICIGGGISNSEDIILDGLSQRVKEKVIYNDRDIADIVIAKYKNDAGILGASII